MATEALVLESTDNLEAQIAAVNSRLKNNGGGSIYFKWFKSHTVHSRTLYAKFYPVKGGVPKEIKCSSADPEQAYVELLDAKGKTANDETLPQEIANIRYEDLRRLLIANYQEHHPASLYTRKNADGQDEVTFGGADDMDKFFKRLPISMITTAKIREFIQSQRRNGFKDPTIRKQLGRLRSAFNLARAEYNLKHIPYFPMPKDSEARQGFLDQKNFDAFLAKFPERLKPTVEFYYYTGARSGAVKAITWGMVIEDADGDINISVPATALKQKENWEFPLVGPLAPLALHIKKMRKSFPKADAPVFDFTNFRKVWNQACHDAGLGTFDKKTCNYVGLHPHDFRRSAARNLIKSGVDESVAMKITGHKTREIFRRYNIQNLSDVKEAMLKVDARKSKVAEMPKAGEK
jgi:integrase